LVALHRRFFFDNQENPMPSRKSAVGAIIIAFAVAAPGAYAQTQPPAGKPSSTAAATVETWTVKQWNAAAAEWAKEKSEWAACQKQGSDKKLSGRASWSFLYDCMKS
jgi:hypothetical protein